MNTGTVIRLLRVKRGMTQAQVAEISGLSSAYISQLETGFKKPSQKAVAKIAKAFGISAEALAFVTLDEDEVSSGRLIEFVADVRPVLLDMIKVSLDENVDHVHEFV